MDLLKDCIFMEDESLGIVFCLRLHMEIQSTLDNFMPVRVLEYQAMDYKEQVDLIYKNPGSKKNAKLYPVISLLVNFTLGNWDGPLDFQSCLNIPPSLKDYLSPYIPSFKLLTLAPKPGEAETFRTMNANKRAVFMGLSVKRNLNIENNSQRRPPRIIQFKDYQF